MEKEGKEGRENGGENGTSDTKEAENTQTADNEVPEKCGVERDTGNGVDQNVADGIKTDACPGPKVLPGTGLDPHTEDASVDTSGKTDGEESGGPQITDASSEPKETKPKTESEEEKRATGNRAQGAAATEDGTKQDGTTKQKANEEGVEAGGTALPAVDAEESLEHVSKDRPVSISVCTSASDFNVKGLVSFLKDLKEHHPELIKEVKVHALPYNDLDHYTFPEENPVDVMLLCHSISSRSFVITDVEDALYDEYLPYCQSVIGKNKIGVIVHDFDDVSHTGQSSRMGSFRSKQPKAFETTSLQITCGHIEKKEQVLEQMQKADREKLLVFLKNASNFPEEMTEQVTESRGLLKKVGDVIVTCGQMASSAIRSLWGSDTLVGRSQDSTSELGSSVDPSEADRNDHGSEKTDEEESGESQITNHPTAPREGSEKTVEVESGEPRIADHSTALPEGSEKTDEEESGEPQIADHSTALPEDSEPKTDEEESGEPQIADHSTALPEGSKKTDEEESGEPRITESSSEPKETGPKTGSGKTDGEESGESEKAESSSEPKETKPKTGSGKKDEVESGELQIGDHSTALPEDSEKTGEEESREPQIADHSTALPEGSEPKTDKEESEEPQIADHTTALPEGSEPITDEEESGESQIAESSSEPNETTPKTGSGKKDEEDSGEPQITDHSTALPEGSEPNTDEEESRGSQIADHSTALPEGSKKTDEEESREPQIADHSTALPEGSKKTDEEESGEPRIAVSSSEPKETGPKTGFGKKDEEDSGESQIADHLTALPEDSEKTGSEKTDEEESGEQQRADHSTALPEGSKKTDEEESGDSQISDHSTALSEGSEKTDEEESGDSQIADHSTALPEGSEKTGAGLDPHAEGTREGPGKTDEKEKGEPKITDSSSDPKDSTSQLVMKEILTDKLLLSLSQRINLNIVTVVYFSIYLGFTTADGTNAVIGANTTTNPQSALLYLLNKFVVKKGRGSESALNLRKRFLENGMKDSADVIKAELEKFKIPVPSDEETLVDTPVFIPSPPCDRPGGIPDSNLEKLTKSLMVDEYSARSLGRKLGFKPTELYRYCGYGKPKDSSGILCMLRDWKYKTSDAKQMTGLLEALKKANLKHLAGDLRSQEGAEEQREAVQTSDGDSVTSPSKSVQPTTTRSDPLTDNPKSSPSVPCDSPPNPTTPNSGSKDPKDEEGARERKTKELSEEEKRATENKANELKLSKEGAAAAGNGTKEDGTPKQKAKKEGVVAGDTELPAEDVEESLEDVSKERPVSISVCTSAYDFNVQGLVSFLKDIMKDQPELIKEVKFHALPYNDLDHYTFPKDHPVDVMLLCHSINNRRFAITDVMDALYDKYLPYCARVVGKNKMGVIVHDFEDMRETVQSSRMSSFKYKQPKAFETTSLQIICGHIEKEEKDLNQMLKADREKLPVFLKNASTFPERMMEQLTESQSLFKKGTDMIVTSCKKGASSCKQSLPGKGTSGGSHQTPQASRDELNLNPPMDPPRIGQQMAGTSNAPAAAHIQGLQQSMASRMNVTSAPQISSSRRISISVCSSAFDHNVKGFMSKLPELQAGPPLPTDIHFRSLPYNGIDSFRFPSNDPVDVMVLCHSVQNRGFSITNVMNALYEKYLQYCHDVIGKKKLAVIVHDFSDCKPKTLDVRMESFRRSQPLTFELVDTVIVCGNLEKPGKIEMRDEDITRLTTFFEQARYEQRENYVVKQSFYKKSFLGIFW